MTIFEKHPEISKGRMTMLIGRVSKFYDSGYSVEEIADAIGKPIELVLELIDVKKKAEENRKR